MVLPHRYCSETNMTNMTNRFHAVLYIFRDKNGRRVYIFRPGNWEPSKISFGMLYSVAYSMMELMSLEPKTQVAGVTMIMDANGYGYKHFSSLSMSDMKMMTKLAEAG